MNEISLLSIPSPILSLAAGANTLWAGGVGGVARYDQQASAWQLCKTGLSITRVAALLYGDEWLLAGGPEGVARSTDGGEHWQAATIDGEFTPITCLCAAPDASVLLAGTLSGLLRSTDGGLTWSAIPDLQEVEITTLRWDADQTVFVGTTYGIFRSVDAGLTWQQSASTAEQAILSIAALSDGRLIAIPEAGGALISADGLTWEASALTLPKETEGAALHRTAHGTLLLGTTTNQLYRSSDQADTWTLSSDVFVFTFAEADDHLWIGTTAGVLTSANDGLTWQALPLPPIHDLSRLVVAADRVYVAGEFTGLAQYDTSNEQWMVLAETPVPITLLHAMPDGRLFVSSPDGLAISDDHGANWQIVMRGFLGHVSHLVLGRNGFGQGVTTTGRYLLRTMDDGLVWQGANSPFGKLTVIGLEIDKAQVILVAFDPATHLTQICRSSDQGESWECGNEVSVQSPYAATYPDPLIISLDGGILRPRDDGGWQLTQLGNTEPLVIRKFVGNSTLIAALTTHGLFTSSDGGQTWQPLAVDGIEPDQLRDVAVTEQQLYVLTSDSVKIVPLA